MAKPSAWRLMAAGTGLLATLAACDPELTSTSVTGTSASPTASSSSASAGTVSPSPLVISLASAVPSTAPVATPFVQPVVTAGPPASPAPPVSQPVQPPNSPLPFASPSRPAVATPTPAPSAVTVCPNGTAQSVIPTMAAPGTVFYVHGSGFIGDARVTIGNRAAEVLRVEPTRLTCRVPADMPADGRVRPVFVDTCPTAQSGLTLWSLNDFNGTVKTAERGLLVSVYPLATTTTALPTDLDTRTPRNTFIAADVDTGDRDFTAGFPGASGLLTEFFALRFTGRIAVPETGPYILKVLSDDGARLYLDGNLVVDNDGTHTKQTASGTVNLVQGTHTFKLDYFQAAQPHLALQLFWSRPPNPLTTSPRPDEPLTADLFTLPDGLAR